MFSKPQTFLKSTYQIVRSSRPRPACSTHAKLLTREPLTWALLPLHPSPLTILLPSATCHASASGPLCLLLRLEHPPPQSPAGAAAAAAAAALRSLLGCLHLGGASLAAGDGLEHRRPPHLHDLFPSPCFILSYDSADVMIYSFVHPSVSVYPSPLRRNAGALLGLYRCYLSPCPRVQNSAWDVLELNKYLVNV